MAMRLRDDSCTDGNIAEEILANAPDRIGNFFAVPKVVE
jgi:aspartyl-tRNA(Asn)/glutamyl-tRNA(Gln) amidotransferase subunit C